MLKYIFSVFLACLPLSQAWADEGHRQISLTQLPYDVPIYGIVFSVAFVFFPFLLAIGIILYKKISKKGSA